MYKFRKVIGKNDIDILFVMLKLTLCQPAKCYKHAICYNKNNATQKNAKSHIDAYCYLPSPRKMKLTKSYRKGASLCDLPLSLSLSLSLFHMV